MKHLLATTALLSLTAGIASAEVTTTGSARMGIIDDFASDAAFTSRVRIIFTTSGESDSGISFGATVRNDQSGVGNEANNDSTVFVSGAFGKLSMGDVDGAAQAAVGQVDGVGFTGLSDLNEIGYVATGGSSGSFLDAAWAAGGGSVPDGVAGDTSALYEYSTGNVSIYASLSQLNHSPDEVFGGAVVTTWSEADAYSVGAAYAMDAYRLSIGYERWDGTRPGNTAKIDNLALGADATFGPVALKARYSEGGSSFDGTDFQDHTQWAASATYSVDALAMTAFVSDQKFEESGVVTVEREAYGLGASYDLGGGASVAGGYVRNSTDDTSAVDLGLNFSF